MDKHRLELFSDGVFAIVLTLMVLDLKAPAQVGIAGMRDMVPGLLVHALAFFLVGAQWMGHHFLFLLVRRVTQGTLWLNLGMLFFVTLIPLGAKLATEDPASPLGAIVLCLTSAGCAVFMGFLVSYWTTDDPAQRAAIKGRQRLARFSMALNFVVYLIAAGLCFVSPWFGYVGLTSMLIYHRVIAHIQMAPAKLAALQAASSGSDGE